MSCPTHALTPPSCDVCGYTGPSLRLCTDCRAVSYCSPEHKLEARKAHQGPCKNVRDRLANATRNSALYTANYPLIVHFRRVRAVTSTLYFFDRIGGRVAVVQSALDQFLDLLDTMSWKLVTFKDYMPALFLRLGRDCEAYEFIARCGEYEVGKWLEENHNFQLSLETELGEYRNYASYVLDSLPAAVRNPQDTDLLEKGVGWLELSHLVALALIKMRCFLRAQEFHATGSVLYNALPQELVDMIHGHVISAVPQARPAIPWSAIDGVPLHMARLEQELRQLYQVVQRHSKHFWVSFFRPSRGMPAPAFIGACARGDCIEADVSYRCIYAAWAETPRAIETMKGLVDGWELGQDGKNCVWFGC